MAPSTRTQNAIIAGLAALAVGASAFAVWSVGRPHPSLNHPETVPTAARSTGVATADQPADDEPVETTEASQATKPESTSGKPTREVIEPSVEGWVDAWSDEADLLVIGDGFSNLPTQWVQLWAGGLGGERAVQIHHWGEAADVDFNDPIVLSASGGDPLTVWNASRAGSTIAAAARRYDRFVDASAEPEAVLVTMGLSSANEDLGDSLDELVGYIDDEVPVLIAVGPEDLYAAGVGDALLDWSEANDDRVSVLDLRDLAPPAPTAEQWARAFEQALDQS